MTGAATGIGRATALRLATKGYSVACVDIDIDNANLVAGEMKNQGDRSVLVCSAAILYQTPALKVSPSEWRR